MPITHKWGIRGVDCRQDHETLEDVVSKIHWRLDSSDGVNEVTTQGSVDLPEPDPTTFLDFPSVTRLDVDDWLAGNLDQLAHESAHEDALMQKAAPAVITRSCPE